MPMLGMWVYKFLIAVYIYSFTMVAVSVSTGVHLQSLIRIPLVNIRLIDLAIAVSAVSATLSLFWHGLGTSRRIRALTILILSFVVFDTFQLLRTFGVLDAQSQFAWYASSLSLLIILDVSRRNISPSDHNLFLAMSVASAVILIVRPFLFPIDSLSGRTSVEMGGRIVFDAPGSKEVISDVAMVPLVLIYAFQAFKMRIPMWIRIVLLAAIPLLLGQLIVSFHRGLLITWLSVVFFTLWTRREKGTGLLVGRFVPIALGLGIFILFFSASIGKLGFDPVDRLISTAEYAVAVDDPTWDKGRFYVQEAALKLWQQSPWIGWGYESLEKFVYGSSPHNFIVTSLFHRGIVGTSILASIFLICYLHTWKLWKLSKHLNAREALFNRCLVFAAWLWLIPLMTQEVLWERYSTSVEYLILGFLVGITRFYEGQMLERQLIR